MNATTDLPDHTLDALEHAAPGLQLDKRQRAMLREMGVRVWLPLPVPAPVLAAATTQFATDSIAAEARQTGATGTFDAQKPVLAVPAVSKPAAQPAASTPAPPPAAVRRPVASAAPAVPAAPVSHAAPGLAPWQVAEPQQLYADASGKNSAARWLVLAESPAQVLQAAYKPFDGDAGKLLDNMLRAARLHQAASVTLSPLVRQTSGSVTADPAVAPPDLLAELQALVTASQPDVIVVMGRLASQAVLQSGTAFGKLRGQIHKLHGVPMVVMQDAAFLLRNLPEKARAWDDLCLAISLVTSRQSA